MLKNKDEFISSDDLKEIVCITCGKIGHISCQNDSEKFIDWSINEAINKGIYSFITNYDEWQNFRKKHEKPKKKPIDPAVIAKLSDIDKKPTDLVKLDDIKIPEKPKKDENTSANTFNSLMMLNMD